MKKFLNSFSAIYVINLDHRVDRWLSFKENWRDILDFSKVKRMSAVYGIELPGYGEGPWFSEYTEGRERDWAGVAGCLMSHKRVIEDASAHGYERILVLEDDAIPSKYFEATEKASDDVLSRYLRMNTSWGLCYLGYNARLERGVRKLNMGSDLLYPENNVELWKVPGALTLHAVIVSRRAFGTILEALPDESEVWSWIARYRAVDTWIKNFFTLKSGLDVLVMAPQIVIQTESMSDILNRMSTNFVKDLTARPKEVSPVMYWLAEWGPGLFRRLLSDLGRFGKFVRYSRRGFPGKKK